MEKLDREVKAYLESARGLLPARDRLGTYPSAEEYYRFIAGSLEGEALDRMLVHLRADPAAQKLIGEARLLIEASVESGRENVPPAFEKRARALMGGASSVRCPHCGQGITPFKRPLAVQKVWGWVWAAIAILSFMLSFIFPYRFMQFLVLTILSGVKWIVDRRAQKTQILVYKALSESVGASHEHLHRTSSHL